MKFHLPHSVSIKKRNYEGKIENGKLLLFLSFVVCVALIDYGKIHKLNFNHATASHNCILKNFSEIINGFLSG